MRATLAPDADIPAYGEVAIFDADSPPALHFARSLSRAKIPLRIYAPNAWPLARFSRSVTRLSACPDPADAARFLPWLEARVRGGEVQLIAPTSDLMAYYISEVLALLPAELQARLPTRDAFHDTLFKDRFQRVCGAIGQDTPPALLPTSLDEVAAKADGLRYPAIIKPRSHVGVGWARGAVVFDAAELRARYSPYDIPPGQQPLLDANPALRWPMVQEYVPGALERLYAVSGVLDVDGAPLACAGCRKTSQWPPLLGIGTIFEPCDDAQVIAHGAAVTQRVLGRGIFELELIVDARTGRFSAIDLNPRGYGQMALNIARGHDLPLLWYRVTTGQPTAPLGAPEASVRWVHAVPFHIGSWLGLARGPARGARLRSYLEAMRGQRVDVVHDPRDPLPGAVFAVRMLRHPGSLVRPYLREDPARLAAPAAPER